MAWWRQLDTAIRPGQPLGSPVTFIRTLCLSFPLQNKAMTADGRDLWPPIREGNVEGDPAPAP